MAECAEAIAATTGLEPGRQRANYIFAGRKFALPLDTGAQTLRGLTTAAGWGPATPTDCTGSRSSVTLYVADRGMQISTRLTFLLEYTVPAIFGLAALAQARLSGGDWAVPAAFTFHFVRRTLESIFVHSFSRATMPASAAARNCAHYWISGGAAVFLAAKAAPRTGMFRGLLFAAWAVTEAGNCWCHVYLALLRVAARAADWSKVDTLSNPHATVNAKAGPFTLTVVRPAEAPVAWMTKHEAKPAWPLPTAGPFKRAAAPNYGFEILGWALLSAAAPNMLAAAVMAFFCASGAFFMAKWARGKSSYYRMHYAWLVTDRGLLLPF